MLRSFMRSFDRSVEFQLATTTILYVVCGKRVSAASLVGCDRFGVTWLTRDSNSGILVIAFGPYQSHGTASTIPPITFHLPLGAFLSLSVLAWQSCLMASNRFSYELHEVTLGQGIISSLFYSSEMAELAPDLVSVYGRRLSLLRYVYWAASIAMLFMVSNSAIAPENATTMTDGKRIRAQIPFILLLLGAGCVWQLHPHPAWQATLLSLAIFSWYRLLLPHMANIDTAAKRTVHTPGRAAFAYTAIRAIAFGEWTIYPVVHLLGALGLISVPAEEALQVNPPPADSHAHAA